MKTVVMGTLLFAMSGAIAQEVDRSQVPEPGPAPIIQLGSYESFELDNGLKVFVVENHKLPVVSWQLTLDRDPIVEGENAGFVQITGDLMGRGTSKWTKAEIDEAVDFIGASFSTSATGIYGSSLKRHMGSLMEVYSEVLLNPTFPDGELEKIKTQMISGLQSEMNDPGAISRNVGSALRYGLDHPYGEQMTEETVSSVTVDMCKNYYNTYFRPNIAYLVIVGDITKDEAQPLVEQYFGSWEAADVPTHEYEPTTGPDGVRVAFVDKVGAVQSSISITYPVDLIPGSKDAIAASVMNGILGSAGFMGRLIQNLREDKAYTYGAYSSLRSDELVGSFTASAEVRNEVTDSAVVQFLYEMDRIVNELVTEEALQNVKNYMNGGFARSLESSQTIARFALNIERYGLPKDYYANYLANLEALTVEDIKAVAEKYIRPDNCYILVVGNKGEVADKLEMFATSGKVEFYDNYGNPVSDAKPIPDGVTIDNVMDAYIDALGGAKKLGKVKNQRFEYEISMSTPQGDMTMTMETAYEKNMKYLMHVYHPMFGTIQKTVFDGSNGQNTSMGMAGATTTDMTDEEKADAKDDAIMFKELDWQSNSKEVKLLNIQEVNDEEAYVVEVTTKDDQLITEYYSVATGLKLKTVRSEDDGMGGTFVVTMEYSDYTDVNGVLVPYTMKIDQGGQAMSASITSAMVNGKLDKATFSITK